MTNTKIRFDCTLALMSILLFYTVAPSIAAASAISQCGAELVEALKTQFTSIKSFETTEAVAEAICRSSTESSETNSEFEIVIKQVPLGGSFDQVEKAASEYCSNTDRSFRESRLEFLAVSILHEDARQILDRCLMVTGASVAPQFLGTYAPNKDFVNVLLYWNPPTELPNTPVLIGDADVRGIAECEPLLLRDGTVINRGGLIQSCKLSGTGDFTISVNSTYGPAVFTDSVEPEVKPEPPPTGPDPTKRYNIVAVNSGLCIHIQNSGNKNQDKFRNEYWTWTCEDGRRGSKGFVFRFVPKGGSEYYQILSPANHLCAHVQGASSKFRAPLWTWECLNKPHFMFEFIPVEGYGPNVYQIKAQHSGLCLHVRGASSDFRAPLWQWDCKNEPHFLFRLEEL